MPSTKSPSATPCLLALDTATERLAVAVAAGDRQWAAAETGGPRASQRLLPLAFELLDAAGLVAADLDAIAFGRGPGAFTGLRTACSVAQGLGLALGRPLLALDSLALVAEAARVRHGLESLWVAMDARMDEVYAGEYRWDGAAWIAAQPPTLWTLAALGERWRGSPPTAVVGSAVGAFGERLVSGTARRFADDEGDSATPRAEALARLARQAWTRGETIDAAQALPLYLRDKVALTTAERAAAAA